MITAIQNSSLNKIVVFAQNSLKLAVSFGDTILTYTLLYFIDIAENVKLLFQFTISKNVSENMKAKESLIHLSITEV